MNFDGYSYLGDDLFEVAGSVESVPIYRNERFATALQLGDPGEHRDARAEFAWIPGGTYTIGLNDDELRQWAALDEEADGGLRHAAPAHEVTLDPYLIARTPLTQQVWDGLAAQLDLELWDQRVSESPHLPVHGLTWSYFQEVAPQLQLRLPTEAQWEVAARGGAHHAFPWGDATHRAFEYAWYGHPHEGGPMSVGQKRPNAFGLFDVAGNVWELCEDAWRDSYAGAPQPDEAPQRVMRGGSYRSCTIAHLLCAFRSSAGLYFSGDDLGIRPVAVTTGGTG